MVVIKKKPSEYYPISLRKLQLDKINLDMGGHHIELHRVCIRISAQHFHYQMNNACREYLVLAVDIKLSDYLSKILNE